MLRIPAWFWEARETAARMRIPGVPFVDRPYDSVVLAEIVQGAIERAQYDRLRAKIELDEKEDTHQARADEAVRRATGR